MSRPRTFARKIDINFSALQIEKVKDRAALDGVNFSDVVRSAVNAYVTPPRARGKRRKHRRAA